MSFTQRPRTARVLLSKTGVIPALALGALTFAPAALARQGADPAQVRDPMKAGGGGAPGDKKDAKVVVSEHMTVDLHVKDEDLSNVLELLSIQTQKNIIASKGVSGKVTATLYGVTFYQALDAILHVNGFGYMENGNFIYVYTQEELKQIQQALKKRVSKTIKLNYLNADDAKEFVTPLLSKDGGEVKINMKPADFQIPASGPIGKNSYALSDTLVVFDYEENVKAIEDLVKQIDTRPSQVLVEATILQTSLNEANAFGVDFSIIGDLSFLDFINTGGPLSAANSLIKGGNGSGTQGFSPPDNKGQAISSTVGNTQGPGGFKIGIVSSDVSIFIKMLDQVTDTVMLSNPKILALNRQPARVLVGKRVGYLNTTTTDTSTTQSVEFLDTGTQLNFRPFISADGDIRMELKPQVSAAEIRNVTDVSGNSVTIPDEVTQEIVTNVNLRDGQTVVLGGLFTENTSFTRRQVPFVGDLPIIGAAFRGHEDNTQRAEIIFLITPTIVTDTLLAGAANRAVETIDNVRTGSRQGLLPFSRTKMTETLNVEGQTLAPDGKFDQALWTIRRSLSLNPFQPEVYQLREAITNKRESWPNPSLLDEVINSEVGLSAGVKPDPNPTEHLKPWGSSEIPLTPVDQPRHGHSASFKAKVSQNSNPTNPAASTDAAQTTTSNPANVASTEPSAQSATTTEPAAQAQATSSDPAQANAAAPVETVGDYLVPTLTEVEKVRVDAVREALPTLRAQIDLYSKMNSGQFPALGSGENSGWNELVVNNVVKQAPSNDYVGGPNASKVVIAEKPDVRFHTDYGWVYNPKTGELWAAGFDNKDRALDKSTAQTKPSVEPTQQQTNVPTPLSLNTDFGPQDPWSSWFGLSPSEWMAMFNDLPATVQHPDAAATVSADPETTK